MSKQDTAFQIIPMPSSGNPVEAYIDGVMSPDGMVSFLVGKLRAGPIDHFTMAIAVENPSGFFVRLPADLERIEDSARELLACNIDAEFKPEAWVNDYAVPVDGSVTFNAIPALIKMELADVVKMFAEGVDFDVLSEGLAEREAHSGPFEVRINEEDVVGMVHLIAGELESLAEGDDRVADIPKALWDDFCINAAALLKLKGESHPDADKRFRVDMIKANGDVISRVRMDDPEAAMRDYITLSKTDFGKEYGRGSYVALVDNELKLDAARIAEGHGTYMVRWGKDEGRAAIEAMEVSMMPVDTITPPKSWDEWKERFKPATSDSCDAEVWGGLLFETKGPDAGKVNAAAVQHTGRVWTLIEADGDFFISSGRHYVNRVGYFLCDVPYTGVMCDFADEDNDSDDEAYRNELCLNVHLYAVKNGVPALRSRLDLDRGNPHADPESGVSLNWVSHPQADLPDGFEFSLSINEIDITPSVKMTLTQFNAATALYQSTPDERMINPVISVEVISRAMFGGVLADVESVGTFNAIDVFSTMDWDSVKAAMESAEYGLLDHAVPDNLKAKCEFFHVRMGSTGCDELVDLIYAYNGRTSFLKDSPEGEVLDWSDGEFSRVVTQEMFENFAEVASKVRHFHQQYEQGRPVFAEDLDEADEPVRERVPGDRG